MSAYMQHVEVFDLLDESWEPKTEHVLEVCRWCEVEAPEDSEPSREGTRDVMCGCEVKVLRN